MNIPFTAALLAGGKSSRMGKDKATLEWEGQALWKRQINLLESLNPQQLLISGHPGGPYIGSSYEIVFDQQEGLGPLCGLQSLLENCDTQRLLVLAVDMPWMTQSVLEELLAGEESLVPHHDNWWEGTAAVYPVSLLPLLRMHLEGPDHSLQSLIREGIKQKLLASYPVPADQIQAFKSWNSPL
jgi:molybdopterin-guanine dinucleotide biosynthesis protein A